MPPKRARELTATEVKRKTKPGLHAVGGCTGLYLQVSAGGARSWILRVTVGSRRRDIGLGGFPDVTLSEARNAARDTRDKIRKGIDPVAERQAARRVLLAAEAKALTFDEAARRCHEDKAHEFRNAKHRRDWISSLDRYASPVIGSLDVSQVEVAHVLEVLRPIWRERTETATRVRQRIEAVLEWARVNGARTGENPARWKGNLDHVLPNPSKIAKVQHHRALPWQKVGAFVADLRQREGMAAKALEFAILTAARSSEVRLATWDEIDLQARVWTVPADRIKSGKAHRVPLSDDAAALLRALPRMQDSPWIFPAPRGGPLSDMTLSALVKRMDAANVKAGGKGWRDPADGGIATPHGIARSSFKDWARSRTAYADEVSELALAHVNSDATRAAYARDELLPQRKQLMADWARFCAEPEPAGDVLDFNRSSLSPQ